MTFATILTLSGPGIQPYSARGLKQTLKPIAAAAVLRRTITAALIDLSRAEFRKYASVISGSDIQPPAFDDFWPGLQLTVGCAARLSYKTSGGIPGRTAVAGSSYTLGDYTFYQPELVMRVVDWNQDEEEWRAGVGWQLSLEEV